MMRYAIHLLWMLLVSINCLNAQIQEEATPPSFNSNQLKSSQAMETFHLKRLKVNKLLREDEQVINTKPLRYAILDEVNIDLKEQGTQSTLSNGRIWRYRIESENALSINLIFKKYKLEQGAQLFIYDDNRSRVFGAFTHKNNKQDDQLAIRDFPGKHIIIEYFEPNHVEGGSLVLGKIGQAYRYLNGSTLKSTKENELIDINCAQGDGVQMEKHAVAQMTFSGSLCTGALINNANNDGTPYFLTANHCIDKQIEAGTLVTYFNFESDNCGGLASESDMTISGSTLISTYANTDFTLLELSATPPDSYKPYYAGWNAETVDVVPSATSIHHPEGVEKKVSVAYGQFFTYPYSIQWDNDVTTTANTHWRVEFNEGLTMGGSSGAPLFDDNNRIIGQLHGGGDNIDFYGIFGKSWRPTTDVNQQLKAYLDPDDTGIKVLDGYAPASNPIDAFPYADFNELCADQKVYLKDGSYFGTPTSWDWQIAPTIGWSFVDGTTAASQNPIVVFDNEQNYSITLEVSDGTNTDQQVRASYISTKGLNVKVSPNGFVQDCFTSFTEFSFNLSGAESYTYELISGLEDLEIDMAKSTEEQVYINKASTFDIDSVLVADLQVVGYHGSCKDTAVGQMEVIYRDNDNVENAYALTMGDNGYFSNICATVQDNEPHPPIGDCEAFGFWCDCEIPNSTYLENTVWFTFVGPENGIISIDCKGFDNQIAVYDANSAQDILSNNYTIVGARDDYYGENHDYAAAINNMEVEPGKTYFLQVDGSACGALGEFQVVLDNMALGINDNMDESLLELEIYPNPATDYFTIKPKVSTKNVSILINNVNGKLVNTYELDYMLAGEAYQLGLPKNLPAGLYNLTLIIDGNSSSYKLVIED